MRLPNISCQASRRQALLFVLISTTLTSSNYWFSIKSVKGLAIDEQPDKSQIATRASGQQHQPGATSANSAQQAASNVAAQRRDTRRPIWALAHMVNSIKELDYRLRKGANAIEVDVNIAKNGVPRYTYHGPPCDCWRHCHQQENFDDFIRFVREESIDIADGVGQNLTLLFLDLKLDPLDEHAKVRAGVELANAVIENLFLKANKNLRRSQLFHLILSINHVNDIELVQNFIHTLEQSNSSYLLERNIGFDVGMNDDLDQIEWMWRRLQSAGNLPYKLNLWQGDGYTNCFSPFYNLERLTQALKRRDSSGGSFHPSKVYHWTIDLHDRMRESLQLGVDGIMTNYPERLISILQEPEFAHEFRLATREDNLFEKISRSSTTMGKGISGRSGGESARFQRSASTSTSGMIGTLIDVLTSWINYIKEIPFLSLPTTFVKKSASALKLERRQTSQLKAAAASTTTTTTAIMTTKVTTTSPKPEPQRLRPLTSSAISSTNVTHVKLNEQQEYNMIENATTTTTTTTTPVQDQTSGTQQRQSLSETLDTALVEEQHKDDRPEYEGPKWYTSLISNMLVSAIKVVLPP